MRKHQLNITGIVNKTKAAVKNAFNVKFELPSLNLNAAALNFAVGA